MSLRLWPLALLATIAGGLWQAPQLIYSASDEITPLAAAQHSDAEIPGNADDLLRAGTLAASQQRLQQQLQQLIWQQSEWLVTPAKALQRLQRDCEARLQHSDLFDNDLLHNDSLPNKLPDCRQRLSAQLQQQWQLTEAQTETLMRYHSELDFQQFTHDYPVTEFETPLAFFEAFWQQQDAVYGQQLSQTVFAPQRERLRFEHRTELFIETSGATADERLTWYQSQIEAYQQRFGQPPYVEPRDHVNRLIALGEHPQMSPEQALQRRYQLRQQWLGEERAQRWHEREQQQLQTQGQLLPL